MDIFSALLKIRVILAVIILICIYPLLLLVALVVKIFSWLKWLVRKPKINLAGDVAMVTGAAHGLGRAIALELAKLGCQIAVVDINLNGAEKTVKKINELYKVRAKAYKVNVARYSELFDLKSSIAHDLGTVTILVNNAGILMHDNSVEPDPIDIQRMIDVNLTSHFWTKLVFLPSMKQLGKGYIVSISSLAAIYPLPYNCTYTASKFGVLGHMKALRMELALEGQHNIHVSTVMPAVLQTNEEFCEIAKKIRLNGLYPMISGEEVARQIVKGMLRGEPEIRVPEIAAVLHRLLIWLPIIWQEKIILLISGEYFRKFYKLRSQ